MVDSVDPVEAIVPGNSGEKVTSLVSAASNNCVVKENGKVFCWGSNFRGQIGDGTMDNALKPTEAAPLLAGDIKTVAIGVLFICAVARSDGTVWCWGDNRYGQFGSGNSSTDPVLKPVLSARGLNGVAQLALGNDFGCALKGDGTLWCWGANGSGQLGTGIDAGTGYSTPTMLNISCP